MALFFNTHLPLPLPLPLPNPPPEKLLITGNHPLSGHVTISGSKNSSLAVLAATLCSSTGTSTLRPVPAISDTASMVSILRSLGASVVVSDKGSDGVVVEVDAGGVRGGVEPCEEMVRGMRAGFLVVGPLVGRFGEAVVDLPGGCRIGRRPVEMHLDGLRELGAIVEMS